VIARCPGRTRLLAELHDRNMRRVPGGTASWTVDDELPLSALRTELASLLRQIGDLDAILRLSFETGDTAHWVLREVGHHLRVEGGLAVAAPPLTGRPATLVGRDLGDPAAEHELGTLEPTTPGLPLSAVAMPPRLGDWLLYLRVSDRVLSRPFRWHGAADTVLPEAPLTRAMAITDLRERQRTLLHHIDMWVADQTGPVGMTGLTAIAGLALSLKGLPPATFDVLALLAQRPALGPALLFTADAAALEALMRLEEGLPFTWVLVPEGAWRDARDALGSRLMDALGAELALSCVQARQAEIARIEPTLMLVLDRPCPDTSLSDAAQGFMHRQADRVPDGSSPFRPEHAALLPAWAFHSDYWRALDAPLAAALHAAGKIVLSDSQRLCIRDVARRHPVWFQGGYIALQRQLRSGSRLP
jgi:hypothetical protein